MNSNKNGKVDILVFIIVIIITGFVVWVISNKLIKGGFDSVIEPLKEKLGLETKGEDLEKQKELERVSKDLLINAESVYTQFQTMMNKCINTIAKSCICGTIDFTRLNDYNLKLSNENDIQILELLDSEKVPVAGKRSKLGKFLILYIDPRLPTEPYLSDEEFAKILRDYSERLKYVSFSKYSVTFNLVKGNIENLGGKMTTIFFEKLTKDSILLSESTEGLNVCST